MARFRGFVFIIVVGMATISGAVKAHGHAYRPSPEALCSMLDRVTLASIDTTVTSCVEAVTEALSASIYVEPSFGPSSATYRGMGTDWLAWAPMVAEYWPAPLVDQAVCLIRHESGGNPYAWNTSSSASGLFQIMYGVWQDSFGLTEREDLDDPVLNTQLAYQIYLRQGFGAWSPYNRGLCR
jgi:hypothetical protein